MTAAAARSALRQSAVFRRTPQQIRQASSASEAASSGAAKAKDATSTAVSKASQGLSKVTASAGSAISKAGPAIAGSLGKIGGRTGRIIGAVQSLVPPTIYYSRVAAELSKAIFHGQKMYPPTTAQFQQYLQPLINAVKNPTSFLSSYPALRNPQQFLQQFRSLSSAQITSIAIVTAEVLGFFTIGEMIGKLKLVGYRGKIEHDH